MALDNWKLSQLQDMERHLQAMSERSLMTAEDHRWYEHRLHAVRNKIRELLDAEKQSTETK